METQREVAFEGILLKANHYRENDLLVKMFTKELGIKTFFIKGGSKKNYKYRSFYLPHTKITAVGTINNQGFSFINSVLTVDEFSSIRMDITKNAYATFIYDLLLHSILDGEILPNWYDKLQRSLELIDNDFNSQVVANIIELQNLQNLGVMPQFNVSPISNKLIHDKYDYSIKYHGMINESEFDRDFKRLHLSLKAAYLIRVFASINLNEINSINISKSVSNEIQKTIDLIYQDSTGLNLKSKKFIKKLNKINFLVDDL